MTAVYKLFIDSEHCRTLMRKGQINQIIPNILLSLIIGCMCHQIQGDQFSHGSFDSPLIGPFHQGLFLSNRPDMYQIIPDDLFFLIGQIVVLNRLQSSPFFNRAISPRIVLIPRVPDLFFSRSALFLQNKSGTCVH